MVLEDKAEALASNYKIWVRKFRHNNENGRGRKRRLPWRAVEQAETLALLVSKETEL